MGFNFPEDIPVIGYDGIDFSRFYRPKFTTYLQNYEELGKAAANELINRIFNPETFIPKNIMVNGMIQEGNTTAPLKKSK